MHMMHMMRMRVMSMHKLVDDLTTALRVRCERLEDVALRATYPLETLGKIDAFADWIDHFCRCNSQSDAADTTFADIRVVHPHRIDNRLAKRIEDVLNGSLLGLLQFAHSTVDLVDDILEDLHAVLEGYDACVSEMQHTIDTLARRSDDAYAHVARIEEAIDDPGAAVPARFDFTSVPTNARTVRTSMMEYEYLECAVNLLGSTLCAAIPHVVEHSKSSDGRCDTMRILEAFGGRTSATLETVCPAIARHIYASLGEPNIQLEKARRRELFYRTNALNYAYAVVHRKTCEYERVCAARTIQRAWLRYAYAPSTNIGRQRMLLAVEDMHDAIARAFKPL